jgi:hypothetical protein
MVFMKIITVYFENNKKPINILLGKNADFVSVTANGTYVSSLLKKFSHLLKETNEILVVPTKRTGLHKTVQENLGPCAFLVKSSFYWYVPRESSVQCTFSDRVSEAV